MFSSLNSLKSFLDKSPLTEGRIKNCTAWAGHSFVMDSKNSCIWCPTCSVTVSVLNQNNFTSFEKRCYNFNGHIVENAPGFVYCIVCGVIERI